jgi:hypothetical protein
MPRYNPIPGREPHEATTIRITASGSFEALCAIHPSMRLTIEVR